MQATISLNGTGWLFKGFIGEDWLWRGSHKPGSLDTRGWHAGMVPGSVQNDLWASGVIPDPYFECNSLAIEWVPARTWLYKKNFVVDAEWSGRRASLRFEGLDYEAQIFLNGERLGSHRGMFTPAVFDVSERLMYGEQNLVVVVIEPAPYEEPQVGRSQRVRTHKPRMNYWWDFCPRMVHLGLWDGVFLDFKGPVTLEDVYVRPELSEARDHAAVPVFVQLNASRQAEIRIETRLSYQGEVISSALKDLSLSEGKSSFYMDFEIGQPRLWWPNGHGGQPLYQAEVRIIDTHSGTREVSDQRRVTFGLRRIEFIANESAGPSALPYTLVVNGRRIYMKGWNWVPMDVLYGVEREAKLERLLSLVRRANVNLLRVWGGGLIEKESFYNLCDQYGILVWQEFIQSSSGIDNNPPTDADFIEMMAGEARQIVVRKRNHASLAIWCGGNELQAGSEQPWDDSHPLLAALHAVVKELDSDRMWLPTSPSGKVFSNSLENIARDPQSLHDVHGPWEHQGLVGQFTLYNQGSSLLHSEFGVEGITNLKTLNALIPKERQWPVSLENPVWNHLGAWWVKEPRWRSMLGDIQEIETLVRAVQFLQADGLRYAVEADRRRKYHNSGSLPWQFNEPYPMAACTSAVDYYANPKPAYYAVAQAYEPVHVSARYPRQAWEGENQFQAEVWVSNTTGNELEDFVLNARVLGVSGRAYLERSERARGKPGAASKQFDLSLPLADLQEDIFFLDLSLCEPGGACLSSNRYVFSRTQDLEPLLRIPSTSLDVRIATKGDHWEVTLTNSGAWTALFAWLEDDRPVNSPGYVYFTENHFCLFPRETRAVRVDWANIPLEERRIAMKSWNTERLRLTE